MSNLMRVRKTCSKSFQRSSNIVPDPQLDLCVIMLNMKKYLAIYLGGATSEEKQEVAPGLEQQMMHDWGIWAQKYADSILDGGAPLGKTKQADRSGVSDTKNAITSYAIVQAESHEAATEMFTTNPHVTLFPNNSIQVMEFLSLPGM